MLSLRPHETLPGVFRAYDEEGRLAATGTLEVPQWHEGGHGASVPVHFVPQGTSLAPRADRDALSAPARPA